MIPASASHPAATVTIVDASGSATNKIAGLTTHVVQGRLQSEVHQCHETDRRGPKYQRGDSNEANVAAVCRPYSVYPANQPDGAASQRTRTMIAPADVAAWTIR